MVALVAMTAATFINCVAFLLFKLSHLKAEKLNCHSYTTAEFIVACCLLVVSSNLILWALANADLITLGSTQSFSMIFNSIMAAYILKEPFTRYDLCSIILITIGSTIYVMYANYE
mmetsp:Transcript_18940/g.18085  ORF Transcript_18940/g.18085 Transcript_18940/m.18085 type:complete len:116 (-) Transcript_18940:1119-1466(-)